MIEWCIKNSVKKHSKGFASTSCAVGENAAVQASSIAVGPRGADHLYF